MTNVLFLKHVAAAAALTAAGQDGATCFSNVYANGGKMVVCGKHISVDTLARACTVRFWLDCW